MGLLKTFLAIGIAVVFCVFIGYGLITIYEPPTNTYAPNDCYQTYNCYQVPKSCESPEKCIPTSQDNAEQTKCLEQLAQCEKEAERNSPFLVYYRNSFFILTVIGIIALIGGILISHIEAIGSGLIGGGILVIFFCLIYTSRYWLSFSKYLGLGVLGIVLAILIFFAYKKAMKKGNPPIN